jgi:hypothetical protein
MSDVMMERDGKRAEVHSGSVALMQGLGWRVAKPQGAQEPAESVSGGESAPTPKRLPAPEHRSESHSVKVPPNWRELHWKQRCQLASQLSGSLVKSPDEANRIIELRSGFQSL